MPKRKGTSRTALASAARHAVASDAGAAAAAAARSSDEELGEEPAIARLDDVESTEERLDVSGHGKISVVTTYLTGALIGPACELTTRRGLATLRATPRAPRARVYARASAHAKLACRSPQPAS